MDLPLIHSAKVEITRACNYRCVHCYNDSRIRHKPISIAQKVQDLDVIIEKLNDYSIERIAFTGGEPTLEFDLLEHGIAKASEFRILSGLHTNLSLFTNNMIRTLMDLGLNDLLVSLPSSDSKTFTKITGNSGAFKSFNDNLSNLSTFDIDFTVNMVVSKFNIGEVYSTGEYLIKNFGIRNFSATPVSISTNYHMDIMLDKMQVIQTLDKLILLKDRFDINVGTLRPIPLCLFDQEKNKDRYFEIFKYRRCGGACTEVYVTMEGDVNPCGSVPISYGNLLGDDDLRSCLGRALIWCNDSSKAESIIPKDCFNCAEQSNCRGGCRGEALIFNGELNSKNPYFQGLIGEPYFPKRKQVTNFMDYRIRFDPECHIEHDPKSSNFVLKAFGQSAEINDYEFNLIKLIFDNKGKSVRSITNSNFLHARHVNKFLNYLDSKGVIQWEQTP